MKKLIECVPNFSEGRDKVKIAKIIEAITNVKGVILLDQESDIAHNRSVVTFAGEPEAVIKAAFFACKKAAELIDLDHHTGEHPRMGATDVIPLIPLQNIDIKECVKYAEILGKRIGEELKIPVYLYEKTARRPERKNLAEVRKGEYEAIKKEIGKVASRKPDFGPSKVGKAGATAVGAREILIAYNVNLKTNDLKTAKAIAKTVRGKDGGFKYVKALGFALEDRGIVQVSMNLVNYKKSTIHDVFEAIKKEAKKYKVEVLESEVIGLIPEDALFEAAKHFLKITQFKKEQILEKVLEEKMTKSAIQPQGSRALGEGPLGSFLERLASKSPTPGGGSVAALSGSLAAALCEMVANITLSSKKYAEVHDEMENVVKKCADLRKQLFDLISEDEKAYGMVVVAYKNKKESEIQAALKMAALTPLKTAQTAAKILEFIKILERKGSRAAASDCGVARHMMDSAIKSAILNVEINLKLIKDKKFVKQTRNLYKNLNG